MMTLRELIEELEDIAKDRGDGIEVVARGDAGSYTPVISVGPDEDGVVRLSLC